MNLTKLTDNLNIISSLADQPTLTATELKAKFDEAGNTIKEYINDILIDDIESGVSSDLSSMKTTLEATIDSELETLKDEITSSLQATLDEMQDTIDSLSNMGSSVSYTVNSGTITGNISCVGKLVVMDLRVVGSYSASSTTTILTIPSGYRPSSQKVFYCQTVSTSDNSTYFKNCDEIYVNTAGTVQLHPVSTGNSSVTRIRLDIHASWVIS